MFLKHKGIWKTWGILTGKKQVVLLSCVSGHRTLGKMLYFGPTMPILSLSLALGSEAQIRIDQCFKCILSQ